MRNTRLLTHAGSGRAGEHVPPDEPGETEGPTESREQRTRHIMSLEDCLAALSRLPGLVAMARHLAGPSN